jgi:hypothetical protein
MSQSFSEQPTTGDAKQEADYRNAEGLSAGPLFIRNRGNFGQLLAPFRTIPKNCGSSLFATNLLTFCFSDHLLHGRLAIQIWVTAQEFLPGGDCSTWIALALPLHHPQIE